MNKIDLKNLDKSSWQSFKFEDIAQKISKNVKPQETEVNVYVGLEHLDREDIHIRRKGVPSDVKGGKLRCYPGDIIFGKRRAYLRKAAIVDFEGICSAHAFVFRANPEVIDPELFPFFLHSDQFMHRMVDISVGGLSPTINWGDLKNQEFLLPPKEEQVQLKTLFLLLDKMVNTKLGFKNTIDKFFRSIRKERVFGTNLNSDFQHVKNTGEIPSHWEIVKIEELFDRIITKNKSLMSSNVLTISAIDGLVNQEEYFNKSVASKDLTPYYLLNNGDFAYNKSYSEGYPAGAIKKLVNYDDGVVSPLYICFRPKKNNSYITYYEYLFDSGFLNSQLLSVAKEGARNHGLLNVSTDDFFSLKIPIPPIEEIKLINEVLNSISMRLSNATRAASSSKSLQKSIINQVF